MAWAALTGPMPWRSVSPGASSSTMACSWARLALSARAAARRAMARRRISPWRTAWARVASWGRRRRASAVRVSSGSAPRASSRSVSSPSRSSARSRLVCAVLAMVRSWRAPSRIRSASRSPSARGVGSRSASRRSANSTARCASIGSDLPRPRRVLRAGCSASMIGRPAAPSARVTPDAVAAGALDRHRQPRAGGVVDDPGQQLGVAGASVPRCWRRRPVWDTAGSRWCWADRRAPCVVGCVGSPGARKHAGVVHRAAPRPGRDRCSDDSDRFGVR